MSAFHERTGDSPKFLDREIDDPDKIVHHDDDDVRSALRGFAADRLVFDRDVEVTSLSRIHGAGGSHTSYFASIALDGGDVADVVLRLPDPTSPVAGGGVVLREYRVQNLLHRAGLKTADPMWVGFDDPVLGPQFYVMQRLKGRSTSDNPPYHAAGWLHDATPEQQGAVWDSALRNLADFHHLDWRTAGFGFLLAEQPGSPLPILDWMFDFARGQLEGTTHADLSGMRRVLGRLEKMRPQPSNDLTLTWLDPHLSNFLFDPVEVTECVAMIDWETLNIGLPEIDVAMLLIVDAMEVGMAKSRLPGFPSEEETVARYEELLGRPLQDLPYYRAVVRTWLTAGVAALETNMIEQGALEARDDVLLDESQLGFLDVMIASLEEGVEADLASPLGR